MTLLEELKNHDWFYDYSDDPTVSRAGSNHRKNLETRLAALHCPFKWWDIHKAIFKAILEDFQQDQDGKYFKPDWKYNYAHLRREELITRNEAEAINNWLTTNAQAHNT